MNPPHPASHSVRSFVRSAWTLLAFQLAAAAVAMVVTGWAALQVRPLLEQREQLARDIDDAKKRMAQLVEDEQRARKEVAALEQRASQLRLDLQGARDSTPVLSEAINAFHARDYVRAIAKYDEALKLNPGDAYIHNLKSYSQFKAGNFEGATRTIVHALELNPTYDWGYFDMARYQCAAGSPDAALRTINDALEKRGKKIRSDLKYFLTVDGEFTRLCGSIRNQLQAISQ